MLYNVLSAAQSSLNRPQNPACGAAQAITTNGLQSAAVPFSCCAWWSPPVILPWAIAAAIQSFDLLYPLSAGPNPDAAGGAWCPVQVWVAPKAVLLILLSIISIW